MKRTLNVLLLFAGAIFLILGLLWFNRPQRTEMAGYVPAESLLFIEVDSMPAVLRAIGSTDAAKTLAPILEIKNEFVRYGLFERFVYWTGIGSAESVVASRAQVAIAVIGLDTVREVDTLWVKARVAMVIETHASESRTRSVIEPRVADLAKRVFGEVRFEQRSTDGAFISVWKAADGKRQIVLLIKGSLAIIANDELATQACLAVRRGDRKSLLGDPTLAELLPRVMTEDSIAFGYMPPSGAAQFVDLKLEQFASRMRLVDAEGNQTAGGLSVLVSKLMRGIVWSTRSKGGGIEDRLYLGLRDDIAERMTYAMETSDTEPLSGLALLPDDTNSISIYNYRNPESAWRSLNATFSARLDAFAAMGLTKLLEASLKSYGIDEPNRFFRAVGPKLVTARLDDLGLHTVSVFVLKDVVTIRSLLKSRFGKLVKTSISGDAEIWTSQDDENGAAAFVAGHLLTGSEEDVKRCLLARAEYKSLEQNSAFGQQLQKRASERDYNVTTISREDSALRSFATLAAVFSSERRPAINWDQLNMTITHLPRAVSETRLTDGGFEQRTQSSFGKIGTLISQAMK
jgi:hypothetical protein